MDDPIFLFYVRRKDQEELIENKILNKQYKIIGISALPGMGKSCFMEHIIAKIQKENGEIMFLRMDMSRWVITSTDVFNNRILTQLASAVGVDKNKCLGDCESKNVMDQVEWIISKGKDIQMCIYFDNIQQPSTDDKYSAKDDAQSFMNKIILNYRLRPLFKFLYTSQLDLNFASLRRVSFNETLRPLRDDEARQLFDHQELDNTDIPDEILQVLNDRDVAHGNPSILMMLASEIIANRGLLQGTDWKQIMMNIETRLSAVSRNNYPNEDKIRNILQAFYKSQSRCLQRCVDNFLKHGTNVDIETVAREENIPEAMVKFSLSTLLRAQVIKRDGGRFFISTLLADSITEISQNGIVDHGHAEETIMDNDVNELNLLSKVVITEKTAEENQDITLKTDQSIQQSMCYSETRTPTVEENQNITIHDLAQSRQQSMCYSETRTRIDEKTKDININNSVESRQECMSYSKARTPVASTEPSYEIQEHNCNMGQDAKQEGFGSFKHHQDKLMPGTTNPETRDHQRHRNESIEDNFYWTDESGLRGENHTQKIVNVTNNNSCSEKASTPVKTPDRNAAQNIQRGISTSAELPTMRDGERNAGMAELQCCELLASQPHAIPPRINMDPSECTEDYLFTSTQDDASQPYMPPQRNSNSSECTEDYLCTSTQDDASQSYNTSPLRNLNPAPPLLCSDDNVSVEDLSDTDLKRTVSPSSG